MLGRDRDFLGAECPCYAGDTLPGNNAVEDTAHNGGFVLVWRLLVAAWYVPLTIYRLIVGY